jgi:DHA1 family bicyclomycin/chloramphenicol resistance-like MFS transporter
MPRSTSAVQRPIGRMLPAALLVLTVFGPISMDLYLPVLPALSVELGAVTSLAQLTITACLAGLAVGQLFVGPLSDRFGRSRPLYSGSAYTSRHRCCARSAPASRR